MTHDQPPKKDAGAASHSGKAGANASEEADPLKDMLKGFFETFRDFEREFKGKARKEMKVGHPVYDQIKKLHEKVTGENPPSEEDIQAELDKIDLTSVGAGLGSGRVLPVADVVEEIYLIPKVPFEKLNKLEKKWKKGDVDSVDLFEQLQELHEKEQLPSGWLQGGVDQLEKDEEAEEEGGSKRFVED